MEEVTPYRERGFAGPRVHLHFSRWDRYLGITAPMTQVPVPTATYEATIIITIRDVLWQELPESYSEESITQYRDAVYNYVSQHYNGVV